MMCLRRRRVGKYIIVVPRGDEVDKMLAYRRQEWKRDLLIWP